MHIAQKGPMSRRHLTLKAVIKMASQSKNYRVKGTASLSHRVRNMAAE
jgi:hypothetical protein